MRLNPGDSYSRGNRRLCHLIRKDAAAAVDDLTEAIKEQPQSSQYLWSRAQAFQLLDNRRAAKDDFTKAVALDPGNVALRYERGQANYQNGDYRDAIEDYLASIQIDPAFSNVHIALAFLYAYCPDPRMRDGRRAVEFATKANELRKYGHAGDLEILAAAYAEAGDFPAAVGWQKKAVLLYSDTITKTNAELLQKRYESGMR